ncbi:MAG: HAD family acid phosphatase [Defluviitaleaceae bacterium]|nr:HAD family acid phosphatase [Defluviitaleaceae bacterium]
MKITLSPLGHTWILDLDGTILKHNGHKSDGYDTLLPGALDFMNNIPGEDMVIFITSRTQDYKEKTEEFLTLHDIRYDCIVYNAPYGERILINDSKPSGLKTTIAIDIERDMGLADLNVSIDRSL